MAKYKETTMAAIFQNRVMSLGDRACCSFKKDGTYVDISWNEVGRMVRDVACYLMSEGIKKGDKVALFSPNRYEWWVVDLAILSIGAVNVPIYATNSPEEAAYIIENSDSKICFAATEDHLARVLKVRKNLPKMKSVIIIDELNKKKAGVVSMADVYKKGQEYRNRGNFEKRINAVKPDDLATIIYTSGTTGNPKGVMLTHDNFVQDVKNTYEDVKHLIDEDDVFLSFLPLSHSLERAVGEYGAIYSGTKTAFAEDISTLMVNFQEVRPTIIVSVPRIYEKVHAGILSKMADASGLKKGIFNWAVNIARKNLPYICNNRPRTGLFAKKYDLADKIIFSKLKEALGLDKLKFAVSGGGPLSVSDAEFFLGMGVKILEGFGLSETTPVTNYNRPTHIKPGTVGPPIPKTVVKISDEGEVLIKGPQVMKGYYKNTKATKEAFTKNGFFKTGDIGVIDEDGFLTITGRIKDIIVTAGGKNISPQNIENSLKASRYIEQVAVIGDKRKYLSALVIPAFEELRKWAKKSGIDFSDDNDLIMQDEVVDMIGKEIAKFTKQFARVEQIRRFRLLNAEWTQDSGELTPTQKVKRRIVNEKYAEQIEGLYPADEVMGGAD